MQNISQACSLNIFHYDVLQFNNLTGLINPDDIIILHFGHSGGFGSLAGPRRVIDLTSLDGAEGFVIRGDEAGDRAGISVSSAGDVNGDGFDDLIVGASLGDEEFWRVNVHGLETLIGSARAAGVRRFVHCSSVGVYGDLHETPADEDTACHPQIAYEITKLEGEKVMRAAILSPLAAGAENS